MADSMTVLRKAGPPGTKRNIAVLGDGFTAADQAAYNQWVDDDADQGRVRARLLLRGRLGVQHLPVNLESVDSRSQRSDLRREGHRRSERRHDRLGDHPQHGARHHLQRLVVALLARVRPEHRGAAAGRDSTSGFRTPTRSSSCSTTRTTAAAVAAVARMCRWASTGRVIAHEFGHGIGGFADEYSVTGNYTGGEQGWINLTTITDRATTKWQQFIDPTTPLPDRRGSRARTTTRARGRPTWSSNFDVGLFEGGGTFNTGIYRPVENCRMNWQQPGVLPGLLHVDQDATATTRPSTTSVARMPATSTAAAGATCCCTMERRSSCSGTTAAGFTHTLQRRRAGAGVLAVPSRTTRSWSATSTVTASTRSSSSTASTGRCPYLGLLVSDGAGGLRLIARYDGDIPGWGGFATQRSLLTARISTATAEDDLIVFNGDDWSMTYVGLLRSTGTAAST